MRLFIITVCIVFVHAFFVTMAEYSHLSPWSPQEVAPFAEGFSLAEGLCALCISWPRFRPSGFDLAIVTCVDFVATAFWLAWMIQEWNGTDIYYASQHLDAYMSFVLSAMLFYACVTIHAWACRANE